MSDEPIPPEPYRQACDAHNNLMKDNETVIHHCNSIGMSEMLKIRAGGGLDTINAKAFPQGAPNAQLAPASELKPSAFGWPDTDFSEGNCVIDTYGTEPWLSLEAGDRAVDFELRDEQGACHWLAEFLSTKPAMLCFGMYTCLAYQASKEAEVELALRHHEKVHFVHVYSVDPHPQADNSPDLGKP